MKNTRSLARKLVFPALILGVVAPGITGCTEEELSAVLAGVEIAARELNDDEDVSFSDWLSDELDD